MLAQKALHARPDTEGRLDTLARITLSRPLDKDEEAILDSSRKAFAQRFEAQPQSAKDLLAVGETHADPSLNPRELAAWTMVASQFLNLDEFLTK